MAAAIYFNYLLLLAIIVTKIYGYCSQNIWHSYCSSCELREKQM